MRQLNLRLHNPRLWLGKNGRKIVILRNFRVYERKFFLRFIYFLTKNLRFRLLLSEKIDGILLMTSSPNLPLVPNAYNRSLLIRHCRVFFPVNWRRLEAGPLEGVFPTEHGIFQPTKVSLPEGFCRGAGAGGRHPVAHRGEALGKTSFWILVVVFCMVYGLMVAAVLWFFICGSCKFRVFSFHA